MNLSQKLFQILGSLVLLLWGAILIYFYHSGRIVEENYLVRFFPVAALAGGIVLLVLGLFNIFTLNYKVEDCGSCCDDHDHDHGAKEHASHDHGDHTHHHDCDHDHDHSHDHAHKEHSHDHQHTDEAEEEHSHHHEQDTPLGILVTVLILACPITYAAAYAPKDFTLESIERKGLYSQNYEAGLSESVPSALRDLSKEAKEKPATGSPDGSGDPATASTEDGDTDTKYYKPYGLDDIKESVGMTPEGALQLGVVEIFYTGGDREMQTILDGQLVEFSAQTIPEKNNNPAGTRLRVMELYVQCCLADARPFSIPIEFGKPTPDYREMGWYKVTGKMTYRTEDGKQTPIVEVTRFEETDEPQKGNMYY